MFLRTVHFESCWRGQIFHAIKTVILLDVLRSSYRSKSQKWGGWNDETCRLVSGARFSRPPDAPLRALRASLGRSHRFEPRCDTRHRPFYVLSDHLGHESVSLQPWLKILELPCSMKTPSAGEGIWMAATTTLDGSPWGLHSLFMAKPPDEMHQTWKDTSQCSCFCGYVEPTSAIFVGHVLHWWLWMSYLWSVWWLDENMVVDACFCWEFGEWCTFFYVFQKNELFVYSGPLLSAIFGHNMSICSTCLKGKMFIFPNLQSWVSGSSFFVGGTIFWCVKMFMCLNFTTTPSKKNEKNMGRLWSCCLRLHIWKSKTIKIIVPSNCWL